MTQIPYIRINSCQIREPGRLDRCYGRYPTLDIEDRLLIYGPKRIKDRVHRLATKSVNLIKREGMAHCTILSRPDGAKNSAALPSNHDIDKP